LTAIELRPSVDSWVDEARAGENKGQAAKLQLRGSGSSLQRQVFEFFSRPFPLGATILEATLKVYLAGDWTGTQTLTFKRVIASWRESQITWNNRPAVTATNSTSVVVTDGADGDEVELDVSAMMGDISAGDDWYGGRFELNVDSQRAIYASEWPVAALRPVLEIDWAVPPETPDHLAPGGGTVISTDLPVLDWQFAGSDHDSPARQAYSQVQVAADEDFADIEYDSGYQANTVSKWDLSVTAYAGVPANATRYWRVRVKNDAGIASEWSDPAEFTRKTAGVLTITNPAVEPDNFVEETTPPIDWTFTGRTQESREIELFKLKSDGSRRRIYHWPRLKTTDTREHIPSKDDDGNKLIQTGFTYLVKVYVWDTQNRESIDGDPAFVAETREFTYERAGTPAAVESLVAEVDGPRVILTWERTLEPDYFSLRVDGEEVEDRIAVEDAFVSGSTYQLKWWRARPRRELAYEVEAVVDDAGTLKHSDGNPEATAETAPVGIWLVDETDSTAVELLDQDEGDFAIYEIAETVQIIGKKAPVRVTNVIGGYRGTSSGTIVGTADRNDFEDLKGRIAGLRLILSDLNLPIRLEEAVPAPTPLPGELKYTATFGWFQVGEYTFDVKGQ
jgi:hypothetical protein